MRLGRRFRGQGDRRRLRLPGRRQGGPPGRQDRQRDERPPRRKGRRKAGLCHGRGQGRRRSFAEVMSGPLPNAGALRQIGLMSTPTGVAIARLDCILAFDGNNRLAVRRLGSKAGLRLHGRGPGDGARAPRILVQGAHPSPGALRRRGRAAGPTACTLPRSRAAPADPEIEFVPVERLDAKPGELAPSLAGHPGRSSTPT